MMNALYTSSSGMMAQQRNVDVISNNLANVNTTGYKKQRLEFKDLLYDTINKPVLAQDGSGKPVGLQVGHGVKPVATLRDFTTGPLVQTGGSLDIAINGAGFLAVKTGDNKIVYTKDGSLKLSMIQGDSTNVRLTTSSGDPILQSDGSTIDIPSSVKDINITKDGSISYVDAQKQTQSIGKIGVFDFANAAGLESIGDNYFTNTTASGQPVSEDTLQDTTNKTE
jgi:flagellar basal-body rod protein FlgG